MRANLYGYVLSDPINAADPTGNVIVVQRHSVSKIGPFHKSIRMIPRNQSRYQNDPRFRRGPGGQFSCTIGAGPSLGVTGLPVSDLNRALDFSPDNEPVGVVQLPYGFTEDQYVDELLNADAAYADNLPYALFPSIAGPGNFYNSNSYVDGIIRATGGSVSGDGPYFGDSNPVPPSAFGKR